MARTLPFLAACVTLTVGCAEPSAELSEADLAAIQDRFDEVARNLSPEDNEAWASNFTEDAVFMFQNTPMIRGRNAIRAWGETDSPVALSVSFSDVEIRGSGDWAWATTTYVAEFEGMDEPDRGKQLVVLQRQTDGTWLTAAAHVSSDLSLRGM